MRFSAGNMIIFPLKGFMKQYGAKIAAAVVAATLFIAGIAVLAVSIGGELLP